MKSLTRTIIVFVIINLTTGNFVLAQNATEEPVRPRLGRRGEQIPEPIPEPLPAPHPEPESAPTPMPAPPVPTPTCTISGKTGIVIDSDTITGLSGVEIQGLPGNPVTDENGFFSATVPYGFSGTIRPVKKGYFFQPNTKSYNNITENLYKCFTAIRIGPPPMFGRNVGRKVLVIPATDIESEDLEAITEDLQVMSHIFDERFREGQEIQGIFLDFGDFFGRDSRSTEAIYIQNYGVIFLMEVNFAFSPEPEPQEQEAKETEKYVDPDWQRAKQKLFSPPGYGGTLVPEEQYSAQQIDQIKKELIRTLKHAANIRNIHPDEWIILTVIGQSRQAGGKYEDYYRITAPRPLPTSRRTRTGRSSSSSRGSYGGGRIGGMMGGMGGSRGEMGGSVMMGGGMGGMAGGSMGGGMGGMMGGMEYGAMGPASATVLTIRAKKSDVDDFAKSELDFEQFQQKAEIFTY